MILLENEISHGWTSLLIEHSAAANAKPGCRITSSGTGSNNEPVQNGRMIRSTSNDDMTRVMEVATQGANITAQNCNVHGRIALRKHCFCACKATINGYTILEY